MTTGQIYFTGNVNQCCLQNQLHHTKQAKADLASQYKYNKSDSG